MVTYIQGYEVTSCRHLSAAAENVTSNMCVCCNATVKEKNMHVHENVIIYVVCVRVPSKNLKIKIIFSRISTIRI